MRRVLAGTPLALLAATSITVASITVAAIAPATATANAKAAAAERRRVGLPFLWPNADLTGISAAGPSDVWVSGVQGAVCIPHIATWGCLWQSDGNPVVRRWDGAQWREYALPGWKGNAPMGRVAAAAPDDVWISAVGLDPQVRYLAHFDGTAFTKVEPPVAGARFGVFADASGTWLATSDGDAPLYRRTGDGWQPAQGTGMSFVSDVQARTATDAWAVGWIGPDRAPAVAHWDGESWQPVSYSRDDAALNTVLPVAADDVWATVQGADYVVRWNGSTWSQVDLPSGIERYDLAVDGSGTIWAADQETVVVDGYYRSRPLLLSYVGGTWQRTPVSMPWGADEMVFAGLATVPGTGAVWAAAKRLQRPARPNERLTARPPRGTAPEKPRPRSPTAAHEPGDRGRAPSIEDATHRSGTRPIERKRAHRSGDSSAFGDRAQRSTRRCLRRALSAATTATPSMARPTWKTSSIQSMPPVVSTPTVCAIAVPMIAATMPTMTVRMMPMGCRPGSSRRPSAPMIAPMTIALMIPVMFMHSVCPLRRHRHLARPGGTPCHRQF
ncbi:hypothetical protein ACN3XK_10005 [Actinomadura welshii]